jgi:hypothetical protein
MDAHTPSSFQPFLDDLTVARPDEARVGRELDETMAKIRKTTFENGGHAIRSVHAKSHGLLEAEMSVFEGLPAPLAQGIFAEATRYPVVMRLSTNPGDILPDSVSTPRGLAIKVLDVEGERLPGLSEQRSQDFVLVNGPTFNAPDGEAFLKNLKMLAATTDRVEGLKKVVSATLRGIETVVETAGGESPTLKALGGQPQTHILGDTFFTQLPIRYGDFIAKLSIAPASQNLLSLKDKPIADTEGENFIRDAVREILATQGAEWEIRVQLCTTLTDMPIEPANVDWDQNQSPYLPVGTLRAKPQDAWSADRAISVDDGMGFSPWHGIVDHWPLGSLMRMRQRAYENSQAFRSERNRCPVHEPASASLP